MNTHRKSLAGNRQSPDMKFDEMAYDRHKQRISVIMGRFMLRHLNGVYREFDGDIVQAIILGEIAHHNITAYYTCGELTTDMEENFWDKQDSWKNLRPCSAFSISEATGIPRETVRRKIGVLTRKGWVKVSADSKVVFTIKVGDHFHDDFNVHYCRELLETAERIRGLLQSDEET